MQLCLRLFVMTFENVNHAIASLRRVYKFWQMKHFYTRFMRKLMKRFRNL